MTSERREDFLAMSIGIRNKMKRIIPLLGLAAGLALFTGCSLPNGATLGGRLFPDGSSGYMVKPALVITGTGGTLTADAIYWSGTNGYPMVLSTNMPPAGTGVQLRQ